MLLYSVATSRNRSISTFLSRCKCSIGVCHPSPLPSKQVLVAMDFVGQYMKMSLIPILQKPTHNSSIHSLIFQQRMMRATSKRNALRLWQQSAPPFNTTVGDEIMLATKYQRWCRHPTMLCYIVWNGLHSFPNIPSLCISVCQGQWRRHDPAFILLSKQILERRLAVIRIRLHELLEMLIGLFLSERCRCGGTGEYEGSASVSLFCCTATLDKFKGQYTSERLAKEVIFGQFQLGNQCSQIIHRIINTVALFLCRPTTSSAANLVIENDCSIRYYVDHGQQVIRGYGWSSMKDKQWRWFHG
jgi:hypothetical protein